DLSDQLDWTNPEGDRCPFDLSKPLPLKGRPSHLTIPVEYFFNNDLEYLKSENMERKYITSIMKTKAASEDSECGQCVKVDKQFGYGYLEEIVVRRADRQLYTFKEGDFINLHLNDIKDMLILVVQHKLFHLDGNVIVDLAVALHGTLKLVRDTLHHRLRNFRLGYNKGRPNKKWSAKDQRRSGMMVKLIEEQLLERRIMRNLERLVGVKELEMDYRLMQRIV
ncbi:hypothetical protein Tco_1452778, partial [Tanacetum coccineum]